MTETLPTTGEGTTPQPRAVIPARRLRPRRIAVLVGLVALTIFLTRFVYLRLTVRPVPRTEYWEARIAALDPPGPHALSGDRAAEVLQAQPWAGVANLSWTLYDATEVLHGSWEPERRDVVEVTKVFRLPEFAQARIDVIEIARRGWPNTFQNGRRLNRNDWKGWLLAHSRWSRESGGGTAAAVEDWLTAIRLERQSFPARSRLDPRRTAGTVSLVAWEMLHTSLEPHDAIDTLLLAAEIDAVFPAEAPSELLEGRRLYHHSLLDLTYAPEPYGWLVVSGVGSNLLYGSGTPSVLWNLTSPVFENLSAARRRTDEYFRTADRFKDMICCRRAQNGQDAEWKRSRLDALIGLAGLYNLLLPNQLDCYYRAHTAKDAALAALALAEFHRRDRRYPEKLDELVPDFLPRLPIDYADRQTLRYIPQGSWYILYSIGGDGIDQVRTMSPSPSPDIRKWPEQDIIYILSKRAEPTRQ